MAIGRLNYDFLNKNEALEKHFEKEGINKHLCALSEMIFKKSNEIGEGNSAVVFQDSEDNGLCYKKLRTLSSAKPFNDIKTEAEFLSELNGAFPGVKVPMPFLTIDAMVTYPGLRPVRQEVLVMEEIKGETIEDLISEKDGKKFPPDFDPESFFKKLKDFIHFMNNEKRIFHRDLEDKNIMLDFNTLEPAIIDFGMSTKTYLSDENPYKDGFNMRDHEMVDIIKERVLRKLKKND